MWGTERQFVSNPHSLQEVKENIQSCQYFKSGCWHIVSSIKSVELVDKKGS
jgi:hypothetical protein